jgi:glycosyltransferase involved in cell wall biosynthesis
VQRALEVLPEIAPSFEVIIVDDGSRDGTAVEAERLATDNEQVRYVGHATNRGYGEALRSGFHAARMEAVAYTDGDRQFDIAELSQLWPLLAGADVVAGYRLKRADPVHRRFIAWTYHRLLRLLFGLRVHDVDCGFKLMRSEVARAVEPRSGGAFFSAEFLLRAQHRGFRVAEVGVTHYPRAWGRPKGATPAVVLRTVREMLALRSTLRREGRASPVDPEAHVRSGS